MFETVLITSLKLFKTLTEFDQYAKKVKKRKKEIAFRKETQLLKNINHNEHSLS